MSISDLERAGSKHHIWPLIYLSLFSSLHPQLIHHGLSHLAREPIFFFFLFSLIPLFCCFLPPLGQDSFSFPLFISGPLPHHVRDAVTSSKSHPMGHLFPSPHTPFFDLSLFALPLRIPTVNPTLKAQPATKASSGSHLVVYCHLSNYLISSSFFSNNLSGRRAFC
jgi:hypothetical protein